jgi:hypothetical protein
MKIDEIFEKLCDIQNKVNELKVDKHGEINHALNGTKTLLIKLMEEKENGK